jgi:hypothetical protein
MEDSEKKFLRIEVTKGDRKYYFYLEDNSPLGECYDAAFQVLVQLADFIKQNVEKMKPVDVQPIEEVKDKVEEAK